MADVDVTVIGAGAVGLAVAARLAGGRDLVLVERRDRHGQETSSRNSEVVHAGMYYPTGSLKAILCVAGNRRFYEYAEARGVPFSRCGKLIVAIEEEELPALRALYQRGLDNGVPLTLLDGADARSMEPEVPAVAAIWSPTTGVMSAHGFMDALREDALRGGAIERTRATVTALALEADGWRVTLQTPAGAESFTSARVVNAAGLESDTVAGLAGIDVDAAGYRLHWCKGSYFAVAPRRAGLLRHLVYPLPGHHSLGTHAVLGLDGRLRFGPDAEYLAERVPDYDVPESRRAEFAAASRLLLPVLEDEDFAPDLAGLRPKLQGPGEGFRDFVVAEESGRGLPGLVNLIGIDSPGLTAALAIAREVEALL